MEPFSMISLIHLMLLSSAHVLALAFPASGTVAIFRALPWPAAWKKRKPLSCMLCMSWWSTWAVLLTLHFTGVMPFAWTLEGVFTRGAELLAAVAVCMWWTGKIVPDLVGTNAALDALLHDADADGEKRLARKAEPK